jgi:NADP-dependent 3-hydroxy acid dehydrogenase YdfG
MPDNELAGATALVTGASRGFDRGIAAALSRAGAQVAGVARDRSPLEELSAELGGSFTAVTADAADLTVAGQLTDAYRPAIPVLNAGATPLPRPIQHQAWQTFSRNWDTGIAHVPLDPRSAARSPLSGGNAGGKATIRFISSYAAAEAGRDGLGIRFASVLPQLTPATALRSKRARRSSISPALATTRMPTFLPPRASAPRPDDLPNQAQTQLEEQT